MSCATYRDPAEYALIRPGDAASHGASMGWDNVITHLPYGDRFRKHRRWMHDNFQSKDALLGYRPVQRRETYTMLAGLLESPVEFIEHVHRSVSAFNPIIQRWD